MKDLMWVWTYEGLNVGLDILYYICKSLNCATLLPLRPYKIYSN